MPFCQIIREGYRFCFDPALIETVRELPPKARLPFSVPNSHGALVVTFRSPAASQRPEQAPIMVLTSNAEINGFYTAWCPLAIPGQPPITSPLGTPAA